MTIRIKLIFLNIVIVLIFCTIILFNFWNTNQNNQYNDLVASGYRAYASVGYCNSACKDLLLTKELNESFAKWRITKTDFVESIREFTGSSLLQEIISNSSDHMELFQSVRMTYQITQKEIEALDPALSEFQLKAVYNPDQPLSEQRNNTDELLKMTNSITTSTNLLHRVFEENLIKLIEIVEIKLTESNASFLIISIIADIIAIFLITVFIFLNIRSLISRIYKIKNVMASVAAKDFSPALADKSKDELGELAGSINDTLQQLCIVFAEIKTTSAETNNLSSEVTSLVSESASLLEQNANSIKSVYEHYETMNNQIRESSMGTEVIQNKIDELARQLEKQVTLISQLSVAIEEITRSIISLVSMIQGNKEISKSVESVLKTGEESNADTNDQITEIISHLHEIQEIAETINSISSQTNLLSMNAAIEAAHVGDEGKGFAVVADEIKKLANSAKDSSIEISEFISKIDGTIQNTSETSTRNIESFENIIQNVKKLSSVFDTIALSLEEVSSTSNEIQNATASLFSISEGFKDDFREMTCGSEQVNSSLHNIDDISKTLLSEIKDINIRAVQIQDKMQDVNKTQNLNKNQTDKIIAEINRFTTAPD